MVESGFHLNYNLIYPGWPCGEFDIKRKGRRPDHSDKESKPHVSSTSRSNLSASNPDASHNRMMAMDACRTFAATGIVWLHSARPEGLGNWEVLGRAGVPLFAGSAAYLCVASVMRDQPKPFWTYVWSRAARVLIPFFAWSLIYLLARSVKPFITGGENKVEFNAGLLWTGTAHHLWFLPFIFVTTIGLFALARFVKPFGGFAVKLTGIILATSCVLGLFMPQSWLAGYADKHFGNSGNFYTLVLSLDAIAALLFGAAAAFLLAGRAPQSQLNTTWRPVGMAGLALFVGATGVLFYQGRSLAGENIAGIGLFIFAVMPFENAALRALAKLGPLAFGIYLSHILAVDLMRNIVPKLLEKRGMVITDVWWDVATFMVALAFGIGISMMLKRAKPLAWLIA